jgi:hypothetical protein
MDQILAVAMATIAVPALCVALGKIRQYRRTEWIRSRIGA